MTYMDPNNATGAELIAQERERQFEIEGYTREHDAEHSKRELARAAAHYILEADVKPPRCPVGWPWERDAWKPSDDPVRNLVKAGALIAAEIDRLKRAAVALDPGLKMVTLNEPPYDFSDPGLSDE